LITQRRNERNEKPGDICSREAAKSAKSAKKFAFSASQRLSVETVYSGPVFYFAFFASSRETGFSI